MLKELKGSAIIQAVGSLIPPEAVEVPEMNLIDENDGYELTVLVKKGCINGGGLPHTAHVVTTIGDEVLNKTAEIASPYFWNEKIVKKFPSLEPVVPIIISFALYKKRWTSPGHKLVGTVQFPLSDLLGILNKGPVEKQFNLFANRRNLTMNGSLILSLELTELEVAVPVQAAEAGAVVLRDLSIVAVVNRWSEAASQRNYMLSLLLCLLDDLCAVLRLASEYDSQHFGDNVKLLLLLGVGLFLAFNYHSWMTVDRRLDSMAQQMEALGRGLAASRGR